METTYTHTIVSSIDERLAEITAEVDKLNEARTALVGRKVERRTARKVERKATPRKRQQPESKSSTRRHARLEAHKQERVARRQRGEREHATNGGVTVEHRGDRKSQILDRAAKGQKARQIADELGTHVNYVYLVVRRAKAEAEREAAATARKARKSAAKRSTGRKTRKAA